MNRSSIVRSLLVVMAVLVTRQRSQSSQPQATISSREARELVQKNMSEDVLFVDQLTTLDADTAQELAKFKGMLSLKGLKTLSKETARELAKQEGNVRFSSGGGALGMARRHDGDLVFQNLEDLSPAAAAALSRYEGNLYLNGLKAISKEVADALANHQGEILTLNRIKSVSTEAASSLARHRGKYLYINGLSAISPEAAQALAQYGGYLEWP